MSTHDHSELRRLTHNFYAAHADSFSSTRASAWKSWTAIIEAATAHTTVNSVLDVGCGNGRFAKFLDSGPLQQAEYLGLDPEPQLLKHAQVNTNRRFEVGDCETATKLDSRFDLVVVFGVMHHLPDAQYRLRIVQQMGSLLNESGLLAISFWQPRNLPNFDNKIKTDTSIDLENNDFLLGWQNDFSQLRYCHHFDDDEISDIANQSGLQVIDRFTGSENDSTNVYLLLTG